MTKKYRHVYCFACVNGKKLFNSLEARWIDNKYYDIPKDCESCYPFDPEDSRGNDLRVNYKESLIGSIILLKWEIEDYFRMKLWKFTLEKIKQFFNRSLL